MARNQKARLEENPDATVEGNPEEVGNENTPTLFDFSGDARVRVLRKDDKTQKMTPHGFFPVDVSEEAILQEYGGGHYRVQLLVPDAGGREQIKRSRDVHLPGPYRPPMGDLPGIGSRDPKVAHPSAAANPVSPNGGTQSVPQVNEILSAGVLNLFQAGAAQQQMMTQMFAQSQQAQTVLMQAVLSNRGPDLAAILAAVTPLITEFLKRPKEERDPLEMLRAVGEIVKQNTGGQSQIAETLGALRDLMDLKNDLSPESTTGNPVLDALPKFAEVMYEGWQQQKATRLAVSGSQPVAPRLPPVPTTPTAETPTDTPIPTDTNVPLYKIVLRREAPRLVAQAQAGRNPEVVAGIAVEFAPANVKGAITEFFRRDTEEVVKELVQEIPPLAEYPTWAIEFVEAVQDILFPGEFDSDDVDAVEEQKDGD